VLYNYGVASNQIALVSNTADEDDDGISDLWEIERFGNTTQTDGTGNQDGDAFSDQEEYIADTHPMDTNSYLWLAIGVSTNAGIQELTFPTSLAREYWVESTTNLMVDPFAPASPVFTGEDGITLWYMTNSVIQHYYRIRVTLP
jgi:hypothetical protein